MNIPFGGLCSSSQGQEVALEIHSYVGNFLCIRSYAIVQENIQHVVNILMTLHARSQSLSKKKDCCVFLISQGHVKITFSLYNLINVNGMNDI